MFTNINHIYSATVYNINLSDHLPALLVYKKKWELKEEVTINCRAYNEENIDRFTERLREVDWSYIEEENDVNDIWRSMFEQF